MGLNAVSSSGKAVFEDEMGLAEGSVPELVEGPEAVPPNSRTGMPLLCAVPMVAVRQVPISACGARKVVSRCLQMDINVRHFGEVVG